jgi:HAD superfamily hydrolase (TIGR01509 family)
MNPSETIKNHQLFLFDMDGTLVNTEPMHGEVLRLLFKEAGVNRTPEDIIHEFHGKGDHQVYLSTPQVMKHFSQDDFLNQKNQMLLKLWEQLSLKNWQDMFTPGLVEFLTAIKSASKKIAVVSASESDVVFGLVKMSGLQKYVDLSIGRQQTALTKPNSSPYLMAMRHFQKKSNETVIFEDSTTGLASANGTGATVIKIIAHGQAPGIGSATWAKFN